MQPSILPLLRRSLFASKYVRNQLSPPLRLVPSQASCVKNERLLSMKSTSEDANSSSPPPSSSSSSSSSSSPSSPSSSSPPHSSSSTQSHTPHSTSSSSHTHDSTKTSGGHGAPSKHTASNSSRSRPPHPHPSTVESIANTTKHWNQEINKTYTDLEKILMERVNESNQRRFRIMFLGTILFGVWVIAVFGEKIRKTLAHETAGLARETLENESLKVQTQELAMAVVQTILNDKDITAHAATFLKDAASAPETQLALLQLTLHVLQHPDSLKEVTILMKNMIDNLVKDEEVQLSLSNLLQSVLAEPSFREALGSFLKDLCSDPELLKSVTELLTKIISNPNVTAASQQLLMQSTSVVLQDGEIVSKSKEFIAEVMDDDMLQREGGDALMKSVTYALKPGIRTIVGVFIISSSVALAKLMFSPF